MPELSVLISFVMITAVVVIVPGPTVTVIVANSLRHGYKAGLANVAGTQLGIALMIVVLAAGFSAVVEYMASLFDILRITGAVYLIWLGIRLWRSNGTLAVTVAHVPDPSGRSFVAQGFMVICSNPKALLFFGALIPQFVSPDSGNPACQTVLFGALFMAIATVFDSVYAFAAGGAGHLLSRSRLKLVERLSGTALIFGGAWLLAMRRQAQGVFQ